MQSTKINYYIWFSSENPARSNLHPIQMYIIFSIYKNSVSGWVCVNKLEMYYLEDNPLRCSISFLKGTCTFKFSQVPPLPDLTHTTDSLLNTYRTNFMDLN